MKRMKQSTPNKSIVLRKATFDDFADILRWRNDPMTIKMSFDSRMIPIKEHVDWFKKALNDPKRIFLIGYQGDKKIGVVRYVQEVDGVHEVSINMAPEWRGKGLGVVFLKDSLSFVKGKIIAKIKPENEASIKAFQKAGYSLKKKDATAVVMEIEI